MIINASWGSIQKYENTVSKLYKCNANIDFNKQCLNKQLTPSYANIKVPKTSPAWSYTQKKLPAIRIKDEIRYLYAKKQQINLKLYHLHLTLANTCGGWWPYIQHTIEEKLRKETDSKYKTLEKKLQNLTHAQKEIPQPQHTFHLRVVNNTEIPFSNKEMELLRKGLKYNTHIKKKNWIQTLALELEKAITQLPANERDVFRKLVAERVQILKQQNPTHNTHPETKIVHSIQRKAKEHGAMITKADKGNTTVILPTHQYETKLQDFISNNDFRTKATDPTKTFQTQIQSTIKQSPTLISKDHRWKYTNMNPTAPTIKGLIKLHKPDQPIHPVVKWPNAPAYRLSKLFTEKVTQLAPLPHSFNIKNKHDLLKKLVDFPMLPHYNLASLDVTNLYSNIPVKETKKIFANILEHNIVTPQTLQELLKWFDTISEQNYFTHKDQIII